MKKILICNYFSASNRGDAAIMEGLISGIREVRPDSEIAIAAYDVESARAFHNEDVLAQPFLDGSIFQFKNFIFALTSVWHRKAVFGKEKASDDRTRFIHAMERQDLVIATGGSNIVGCYGFGPFGHLWALWMAKRLGKKTVLMGQSIGPLNSVLLRTFAAYVLRRLDYIVLRDQASLDLLKSIGVPPERMQATADLAFLMDPERGAKRDRLGQLRAEGIPVVDPDSLNISISVRHKFPSMSRESYERYIEVMKGFIEWAVENHAARIFLIATGTRFYRYNGDDRYLGIDLWNAVKPSCRANVKVLLNEYSPHDFIRFFKTMNVHIGTRMHSNILCALSGTPFIGIGYEFKTIELMRNLDWMDFFQDIHEMDLERLKSQLKTLAEDQDRVRARLHQAVAALQDQARRGFDCVK